MNIVKSKKALLLMGIILVCCLLVAYNSNFFKVKDTFTGTIEIVSEYGGMRVNIEESTDKNLGGLVDVAIPDDTTEKFNVGDKVKVGFDGTVLEISPVQIQAITLEKIE